MKLIDANIILRYLLNDHAEMSVKAKEVILSESVLILTQVVAEVIYVLGGVYKTPRPDISAALRKIASIPTVQIENSEVVLLAVDEYASTKFDFVDLLLFAHHQIMGYAVETFDKALIQKLSSIKKQAD